MIFLSCPPVYTLPGTWTKCNAIIPHYNADPNVTFAISFIVIVILLAGFGVYKAFFNNKGCLLYTSPSPRDRSVSRMPSSA